MQYRVAWRINGETGHGDWLDDYADVAAWVANLNDEFGTGTHWVDYSS